MNQPVMTVPTTDANRPQDPGAGHANPTDRPHDSHALGGILAAAIRIVASLTLVSRLTGLVRDILTAGLFGDTGIGSAFNAAFQVPNIFRRLFGEGALSAAFLPEYTRQRQDSAEVADQLASLTLRALTLTTALIVLVVEVALMVVLIVARNDPDRVLSIRLMMLMLPMMPMVCTTAILGGVLQSHGKFGPPAAAPVILNLMMIGAALVPFFWKGIPKETSAYLVGVAAVIASVLQIVWSMLALRGLVRWTKITSAASESARRVLKRFVPVLLGLGTLQLNTMMDTLIAMWPIWFGATMFGFAVTLDESSNSILSYTSRLYQFPLGVFGIAVATAVFPLLSRTAGHSVAFVDVLRRGVRLSLFIGIPASIGLVAVREDLVHTMFWKFSREGLERSALVVACYAPAVWAYSLNHVLTRAFYARGDTVTPMRVAMAMVAANLSLNLILIWYLREAGLALSTGTCAMLQALVVCWAAKRKLDANVFDRSTVVGATKVFAVALLMGACVWAVISLWPAPATWRQHFARLSVATLVGGMSYIALAFVFGLEELRWLVRRAPAGVKMESMMAE
ncbi:MAG: murein biosynthesis integral membrane protein MurJ [Phycisphaeraceae bacterium]|nr:murein biosynthesis integral membrane protein MurJ [Phycisphaeraceae bacterium]